MVLASDPETGETAYKEVLNTFIYVKDTLVYVEVNDETIETTKEHPSWVEGQGWTKAKFLKAGDQLRDANGNTVNIENVDIVPLPENQYTLVYNFEVADFHTYYVADSNILVHNVCPNGYKTGDIDIYENLFPQANRAVGYKNKKSDGCVQAHHIIQDEWAKQSGIKGYNSKKA